MQARRPASAEDSTLVVPASLLCIVLLNGMPSQHAQPHAMLHGSAAMASPDDTVCAHPWQVVDFCNNYTQLLGMGFGPATAAGALAKTRNDLNAATEICLGEA